MSQINQNFSRAMKFCSSCYLNLKEKKFTVLYTRDQFIIQRQRCASLRQVCVRYRVAERVPYDT